jgi:hypothetical protein
MPVKEDALADQRIMSTIATYEIPQKQGPQPRLENYCPPERVSGERTE